MARPRPEQPTLTTPRRKFPMIRTVLALFAFAVVLCGFIVLDPMSKLGQTDTATAPELVADQPEVTRAQTDIGSLQSAVALAGTEQPASSAAQIAAATTLGGDAGQRIFAASGGVQTRTGPTVITDDSSISETTAAVLAGLGLNTGAAAPTDDSLMTQTAGVLAGIRGVTGAPQTTTAPQSALQSLVIDALREGQTDSYIDEIVNAAASEGRVSVPEILVTSDGRVDTHVLLASIVSQAQIANGGAAPAVPEVPAGGSDGVEVRVVQRANETQQYTFYTVNAGDSLGAIAVKFYGSVDHYQTIFEANRSILSSPDLIRSGQRLVIPKLDA